MATRFLIFGGVAKDREKIMNNAKIEEHKGKYVDSHWSTAGYGERVLATLVVVYEVHENSDADIVYVRGAPRARRCVVQEARDQPGRY